MDIEKKFKNLLFNFRLKKKFKKHNQIFFSKKYYNNKDIILVELNKFCEIHILYSYLSNILAEKFKAKIIGYNSRFFLNFKNLLFFILKKFLNLDYFAVYKSFNVPEFFYPRKRKNESILVVVV